jgi:hypothetical protein
MPKNLINYQNTIIYKIVCNDLNIKDCYVGSTTNFIKRKCGHKTSCNNPNDKSYKLFYVYKFIRNNGGWDNFSMIEIEKYPCNDSNEAHKRERYQMELLGATLNSQNAYRSKEEVKIYNEKFYDDNKDKILETRHNYYYNNKETISERHKEFYL